LLHCNSGFNCCNCHFRRYVIDLSGCPRNGLLVSRSQTAPRNASPVSRNRSDVPRNAKIVPRNILAPRNDPAVPGNAGTVSRNAENQNEQVSFSYTPRLLFGKAESPRGDINLGQHSLFFIFRYTCALVNARPPPEDTCSLLQERSYPRLLDSATGWKEYPRHPTVGWLYISHT
jgi:hypothetical protein